MKLKQILQLLPQSLTTHVYFIPVVVSKPISVSFHEYVYYALLAINIFVIGIFITHYAHRWKIKHYLSSYNMFFYKHIFNSLNNMNQIGTNK